MDAHFEEISETSILDKFKEHLGDFELPEAPQSLMPNANVMSRVYCVHDDDGFEHYIPYNDAVQLRYKSLGSTPEQDIAEICAQRELYTADKLNKEQRAVFDYAIMNDRNVIVLQAGPGTGKTFTMLTISNHLATTDKMNMANVVIYKRDLVDTYRLSAYGYTVAKFVMRIFDIKYKAYESLERHMSQTMSIEYFINVIVTLMRNVQLETKDDNFRTRLLILDEYTVIPKPLLLIVMLTLKRYQIGAIICGDRNQLQNIHNSTHAGDCSAFDIVSAFADRSFMLSRNERCTDVVYNEKVNFIGRYSRDVPVDSWGFAVISAMFYKNLVRTVSPQDMILGRYHSLITDAVDKIVKNVDYNIASAVWFIESADPPESVHGVQLQPNSGIYLPNPTVRYCEAIQRYTAENEDCGSLKNPKPLPANVAKHCPGKYLTYLPLIIGQSYFLRDFTERTLSTLQSYTLDSFGQVQTVTVTSQHKQQQAQLTESNPEISLSRTHCNRVMFEKHMTYLLCDGKDNANNVRGALNNFPIYPAFIMSIYMSQGRTISNSVSFLLQHSTYQCLYVAVSRVTSADNVNAVSIPNTVPYFVSTVLNFDITDLRPLTVEEISEKLLYGNYWYYYVDIGHDDVIHAALNALMLPEKRDRIVAREHLQRLIVSKKINSQILRYNPTAYGRKSEESSVERRETMTFLLSIIKTLIALASLSEIESRAWIRCLLTSKDAVRYLNCDKNYIFTQPNDFDTHNVLNVVCDIDRTTAFDLQTETVGFFIRKTAVPQPENLVNSCGFDAVLANTDALGNKTYTTSFLKSLERLQDSNDCIPIEELYALLKDRLRNPPNIECFTSRASTVAVAKEELKSPSFRQSVGKRFANANVREVKKQKTFV